MASTRGEPFGLYQTESIKQSEERMNRDTTMNTIISDVRDIASIEYQALQTIMNAQIVFVDDNGNQYEYDGVCISEGKLKLSIKPTHSPIGLKIKKRYLNSDGKLVTDLLSFNFETIETIRQERESMPPENFLTRSEIDLYLNDGFTINTFQASYCKEGHEFSPIEESK
jgi:hypothetical protein